MAALIALLAAVIASLWPWLQALQRGLRFRRLIKRELAEIGPHPPTFDPEKPWWEHATKRFIHEEIFRRESISQNRDFLLSLKPDVVYQVSQLWIALEKRDAVQWKHFLNAVASNPRLESDKLTCAHTRWEAIIDRQREDWRETMGFPTPYRQDAALERTGPLFEKRFDAYGRLLLLIDYGTESAPKQLSLRERVAVADELRAWFYSDGAGLLLSGRALQQFNRVREALTAADGGPAAIRHEISKLRTDLKIDLGVRQPREREVADAWPEEERW